MEEIPGPRASTESGQHNLMVYASKRKILMWMLAMIGLSAVLVFGAVSPLATPSTTGAPTSFRIVDLVVGLVVVGGIVVRLLSPLFSSDPLLVVTHEGIVVRSWLFGFGLIPWPQIATLRTATVRLPKYTMLRLALRDWRVIRAHQNTLQAMLYWLSGWALLWPRTVVVSDSVLAVPIPVLLHQIRSRYQAELMQHSIHVEILAD